MSTSLLYHTWGIRGYTYIHTRYERGKTIFRIEQDAATLRSSCCGSEKIIKRGVTKRTFKATPVGNRTVFIEVLVQRVQCSECGVCQQSCPVMFTIIYKLFVHVSEKQNF